MKFYDENLNEFFLYIYTECGYEGISFVKHFVSDRKILPEEISEVQKEYDSFKEDIISQIEKVKEETGITNLLRKKLSKKDEEEHRKRFKDYAEKIQKVPFLEDYVDFLVKKTGLREVYIDEI